MLPVASTIAAGRRSFGAGDSACTATRNGPNAPGIVGTRVWPADCDRAFAKPPPNPPPSVQRQWGLGARRNPKDCREAVPPLPPGRCCYGAECATAAPAETLVVAVRHGFDDWFPLPDPLAGC